jgi:hypothetical protein
VTDNLKHFPEDKIPPGIQIVSPSEFAANTVDVSPATALRAVTAITARFDKPPMSVDEFLSILRERYGMDEAPLVVSSPACSVACMGLELRPRSCGAATNS